MLDNGTGCVFITRLLEKASNWIGSVFWKSFHPYGPLLGMYDLCLSVQGDILSVFQVTWSHDWTNQSKSCSYGMIIDCMSTSPCWDVAKNRTVQMLSAWVEGEYESMVCMLKDLNEFFFEDCACIYTILYLGFWLWGSLCLTICSN